jgi:hypothetical protein
MIHAAGAVMSHLEDPRPDPWRPSKPNDPPSEPRRPQPDPQRRISLVAIH